MTEAFTKKELKIIKDYEDYVNSPMSDGYTRVYLENKHSMSIESMEKLYNKYKKSKYKNLTKEQAYDLIRKQLKIYNEKKNFGCNPYFPREEIEEIVYAVKQ